jgi:hypothetical protein
MHVRPVVIQALSAALLLSGCRNADAIGDAQRGTAVVTGDDHVKASANSTCRLFSSAEAAGYIGEPVGPPENAAMGGGCAWPAKGGAGEVVVAIVSASDHERPNQAAGFHNIGSPGREGFVTPDMGGWIAGTIVADKAIRVTVIGKGASEANAIKLLSDAASRSSGG